VLLGIGAAAEGDLDARPSHHDGEEEHEHDDFDSFIVDLPEIEDADALIARLKAAAEAHDILRIKGFVAMAGKPLRLAVQGVGNRFRSGFDRAWDKEEIRQGRLVVIGRSGFDRDGIAAAILG
jgi:cobalamin biosynthesis protein CobW